MQFLLPGVLSGDSASFSGEELTSMLNNGYEMYGKAKYAPAIVLFDKWLATEKTGNMIERAEAEYHAALSAMRLMSPDAEYRMQRFITSQR